MGNKVTNRWSGVRKLSQKDMGVVKEVLWLRNGEASHPDQIPNFEIGDSWVDIEQPILTNLPSPLSLSLLQETRVSPSRLLDPSPRRTRWKLVDCLERWVNYPLFDNCTQLRLTERFDEM